MRRARRKVGRHGLRSGALTLILGAWVSTGALAQDFDPGSLAADDLALIQEMLESERSHVRRSLPVSEQVVTIVRTETQPRICRHFVLQSLAGDQQRGVGCRVGAGQWQLAAAIGTVAQAPVIPPPATTVDNTATPRVTTVLRPVEAALDEPAAAPIVSSPIATTGVPLPGRRPIAETEQAPVATEEDAQASPAVVPAALAAVPLPAPRPTGRSTGPIATDGTEAESAALDEREADIAEAPEAAIIARESLELDETGTAAEVAQGDTDLSEGLTEDRPEPEPSRTPAPIEPPVPGLRP
ncbi:MAG: hypothetical protein AAGG65_09705 [Pseudomonadota bacterium]